MSIFDPMPGIDSLQQESAPFVLLGKGSLLPEKPDSSALINMKSSLEQSLDWGSGLQLHEVKKGNDVWMFVLLTLLVGTVAVLRLGYHNKFRQLTDAFISARYMKQLMREELVLSHPFSITFLLNYAFSGGLLIFWALHFFSISWLNLPDFLEFLIISGALFLFLLIKSIIHLITQFIIGEDGGLTENRYALLLFPEITGILLLPFAILASFGPDYLFVPSLLIAGSLFLMIYLYRIGRGILAGLNAGSGVVFIFLYLCALEILPLIVTIKVLVSKIG
ncbi:MAG: DUF4271 domain-containing protein [Flavobacteriales bacterium]|nr:DUF4271 domain-containing protein [Flavobacteriales bacterium]